MFGTQEKTEENQQPQSKGLLGGLDLVDPLGVCKMEIGAGFNLCDNVGQSTGVKQILLIGLAIVIIVLGDLFDILAWGIGWIPIIGDIFGNTVLGNIIDAVGLIVLLFLIGAPALLGIFEFVDVFGFVPIIGDIAGIIEWLPTWTFALVLYGILYFVRGGTIKLPNVKIPFIND